MSIHDIYSSGIFQVLTRFSINLAIYFIFSQHVSQNCNVFIKRANVTLENITSQFRIQDVLVSDVTQVAGPVDFCFMGIFLQVKLLLLFPSI